VITGAAFTLSEPPLLAVVLTALIASIRNKSPLCAAVTPITDSVVVLFPEKPLPFVMLLQVVPPFADICHWNVGAGVPFPPLVNVAFAPDTRVTFPGCVVIPGADVTVSVPLLLATPAGTTELIARHRNKSVLCVEFAAITVKVTPVFPEKPAPFVTLLNDVPAFVEICHCNVGAGFPVVATVNVAFAPAATVVFAGCVENAGANCTVNVALPLADVPVALNASARNSHPFSVEFVASADNVTVLFPENAALFVMFENTTPPVVDTCH
jgi:hypothetical protein